jgi:hypothetical protein
LEEAVLSYSKFIPNFQVLRDEIGKEGGLYEISGNPRRVIRFYKRGGMTGRCLCNGLFKT